ncbi:MAG TPA: CHASE2 domain-containing protein [Rhizomicrobium sp.]|jgi:hypothetical protein|nr:CHASE2 domain-containing protein [Rhizomicrobium sp.]
MLDFPERRLLLRAFVSAVVGLTLIAWNILGVDRKSEEASNNVFLHFVAPFLGERLSPYPVTVVLVTPRALKRLNRVAEDRYNKDETSYQKTEKLYRLAKAQHQVAADPGPEPVKQIWSWPFSFQQQADILETIAGDEPRAIFYDVAFYQHRTLKEQGYLSPAQDDDARPFADMIRDTVARRGKADSHCIGATQAGTNGIPVFLGVVPEVTVIPALCEAGAQGVRVDWTEAPGSYPLDSRPLREADAADETAEADSPKFATPAAQLFIELCSGANRRPAASPVACPKTMPFHWQGNAPLGVPSPLGVAWRAGVDPDQGYLVDVGKCEIDRHQSPLRRLGDAISALFTEVLKHGEGANNPCFNTRFLPVDQVVRPFSSTALSAALKGKVVMIGTELPGINDIVYSPVQGQVPGVFMHATALENLLHWGRDYFGDIEASRWDWWWLQAVSCLIVTVMIYSAVQAIEWFRRNPPSLQMLAYSFRGPGPRLVRDAIVDLFQLLGLAAAIFAVLLLLTLVVFFVFRIAPLNWVGMAALVLGLTMDEIGGTAADALVVLAMSFSPARRLARAFFPHPSLE